MGKLTIQEVAKILTEKNGLEPREASRFAAEMFSVILQRLEEGDTVKVKGLGTFKIINVEARESVSVRTGERVVIDSHAKVTFTPDTIMRELVNKPFSQFETVVLNDGVEFDDINDEVTEETAEETVIEEPVVEETPLVEVPVIEETSAVEEEPVVEEPVVEEPEEEQVTEEEPAELIDFYEEEEQESELHWGRWLLGGLAVLVLMMGAAYGGYEYGLQQQVVVMTDTLVVRDTVYMADIQNESQDSAVVEETAEESIMDEMISAPMAKKGAQAEAQAKPEPQAKLTSQVKNEPAAEQLDQWSAKDERVRLGAYRIVGLLREVKVLEGQTFYSICRAHLGPDMQCYVEVYNNLPRNPQIKTGQVLKIPKLEPRKRRK